MKIVPFKLIRSLDNSKKIKKLKNLFSYEKCPCGRRRSLMALGLGRGEGLNYASAAFLCQSMTFECGKISGADFYVRCRRLS